MTEPFVSIGQAAAGIVAKLARERVTAPGLYRMSTADYHADPCPEPSLSNSIAKVLVHKSPRHAWIAHPRLNPDHIPDGNPDRKREIGSVAHALLLGHGADIVKIDADDYRKDATKDVRAKAYAAGDLPILAPDLSVAKIMAKIARDEFSAYPEIAPTLSESGGTSELVAVCREGPAWLRCMIDRASTDLRVVLDYKTTGDAHPDACAARISDNDFQMQDPFYRRVLDAVDPEGRGRRRFFFLYQEQEEPYACTVHELDGHHVHMGARQVEAAVRIWTECMTEQRWPSYPRVIHRVEMKPWAEQKWLDREIAEFDQERASQRASIAPDHLMAG